MGELENERINRLENGVNANNANNTRNANNTTKGNRQVELFGRVGQVRGGVVVFGKKRKRAEERRVGF
ncbi:hypothetical protein AM608_05840 [Capnocytophaga sp. oral taxon 323]|nr:hypothetical protein AM608_05840 [Capnocytophaga sp. oral taxon 323]